MKISEIIKKNYKLVAGESNPNGGLYGAKELIKFERNGDFYLSYSMTQGILNSEFSEPQIIQPDYLDIIRQVDSVEMAANGLREGFI